MFCVWVRPPIARATLVLPFPGGPYRKMEVPELIAGPRDWKVFSDRTRPESTWRISRLVTVMRPRPWRVIESMYTFKGTGA